MGNDMGGATVQDPASQVKRIVKVLISQLLYFRLIKFL